MLLNIYAAFMFASACVILILAVLAGLFDGRKARR